MAGNTVSFPDLALDKFSGKDSDQDAKFFPLTLENKINFSLWSRPPDFAERARYLSIKKTKKPYFIHFFEDQQQNGMPTQ